MAREQQAVIQVIDNVVNGVSNHRNYDAKKLETPVNKMISETSHAHIKFRIDVGGYTESSRNARALKITDIKLEIGVFRISLKVQLHDCAEKWIIYIYLSKSLQKRARALEFQKELKIAAKNVCSKEKTVDNPPVPANDAGAPNDSGVPSDDTPDLPKKKRTRIASLVTADAIIAILKRWRKAFSVEQKISQRDFKKLVEHVFPGNVNTTLVVNYFEKRKYLTLERPVSRKVLVQLTDHARTVLAEHDRDVQNKEGVDELKAFSRGATPAVKKLLSLATLHAELAEMTREEDALTAEIIALQKRCEEIAQKKAAHQKKIVQEIGAVDAQGLSKLLTMAQKN